jgi:hypothetical protein
LYWCASNTNGSNSTPTGWANRSQCKFKVNNVAKALIIEGIEAMGLDKIDDSYDYLLRMPIYSLTKEMYEKIKEDFTTKKEEIKILEATDPKDMYLLDLTELKKKFK